MIAPGDGAIESALAFVAWKNLLKKKKKAQRIKIWFARASLMLAFYLPSDPPLRNKRRRGPCQFKIAASPGRPQRLLLAASLPGPPTEKKASMGHRTISTLR